MTEQTTERVAYCTGCKLKRPFEPTTEIKMRPNGVVGQQTGTCRVCQRRVSWIGRP